MPKPVKAFQRAMIAALFVLAVLSVGMPARALALDALQFLETLEKRVAESGHSLTHGGIERDGDGAIVRDLVIVNKANGDRISASEIRFSGLTETASRGFSFGTVQLRDVVLDTTPGKGGRASVKIATVEGSGVLLAGSGEGAAFRMRPGAAERFSLGETTVISSGPESVTATLDGIEITGFERISDRNFNLGSLSIRPLSGTFASEDGGSGRFELGGLELSGASHFGLTGVEIGRLSLDPLSIEGRDKQDRPFRFAFQGFSSRNAYFPDAEGPESQKLFSEEPTLFNAGPMEFLMNGTRLFGLGGLAAEASLDEATGRYGGTGAVTDLFLNVRDLPLDPSQEIARQQLAALGYDSISLGIEIESWWGMEEGVIDIPKYIISIDKAAALEIALRISGYTEAMMRRLRQLSNAASFARSGDDQQAANLQIMAEMAALLVEKFRITIRDDSLLNRLVAMQSEKMGQKADEMKAALPFIAGAFLAPLEIPKFASTVSEAVRGFVSGNGTITLSAEPAKPVSFVEIMGIAAGIKAGNVKPAEVIDRLSLTVASE